MALSTPTSTLFSGEFCHALDGKNRVTIPSVWRATEADEFFMISDSNGTCLRVMPPDRFRAVADQVSAIPNVSAQEQRAFLRQFYSRAQRVVADKQGRLVVPEEYCQRFKLHDEIMLVGAHDTFEVWNCDAWKATQQTETPTYARVAGLLGI